MSGVCYRGVFEVCRRGESGVSQKRVATTPTPLPLVAYGASDERDRLETLRPQAR